MADPLVAGAGEPPGRTPVARREVVERVLRTADELERALRAQAAREAQLVLETRAGPVRVGPAGRAVVGRGARCDVVVPGEGVSRAHAAIVRRGAAWWIEDLGSRNGTWCRGERVSRRRLADGDVVRLGGEPVRCRLH